MVDVCLASVVDNAEWAETSSVHMRQVGAEHVWEFLTSLQNPPVGLVLIIQILVVIGLLRLSWGLWFHFRYRAGVPLVLHRFGNGPVRLGAGGDKDRPAAEAAGRRTADLYTDELLARLTAYIAEDPPGPLTPGGLETTTPVASAEAAEGSTSWLAVLMSLTFARRPGYHAFLTLLAGGDTSGASDLVSVGIEIVYQPSGRVVAVQTITDTREEIVAALGCYCIQTLRRLQRQVQRYTPWWELWHSETGYREYRRGLTLSANGLALLREARQAWGATQGSTEQPRGRQMHEDKRGQAIAQFEKAVVAFRRACAADPANILPQMALASAFEVLERFPHAILVYARCRQMWPESVEPAYRLAVYDELHERPDGHPPEGQIDELVRLLRLRRIIWNWLRAWYTRCPGERRYWGSWLRQWGTRTSSQRAGRSRRRDVLAAARVAGLAVGVRRMVGRQPVFATEPGWTLTPDRPHEQTNTLFRKLAAQIDGGLSGHPVVRLLHPGETGQRWRRVAIHRTDWHPAVYSVATRLDRRKRHRHKRIGWLAHYNAACFFALSIDLLPAHRPWQSDTKHWEEDCATAAIRELSLALQIPESRLDPAWPQTDDDLEPLANALLRLQRDNEFHPLVAWLPYLPFLQNPDTHA